MKFTTEQVADLLKQIGIPDVELVEADSDYDNETALKAIDASRSKILEPSFRSSILQELTGQATRATAAAVTKRLKALTGIENSELKDLPWEEQLDKAFEYSNSKLSKDTEGVREEMKLMLEKHNQALENANKKVKETEDNWKQKWNSREIKSSLESVLKDAPILEGADRGIIAEDFQYHLASKYHISYDEAGKLVNLFTKENPEMPALNESKTAQVTLLDEAKSFLTPRGLWQTDMRRTPPPTGGDPYPGNNPINNNSNNVDPKEAQKAIRDNYTKQPV